MAEFRWILAVLGALLLGGIWWWGSRRSRQAPGNAEFRESSAAAAPDLEPRHHIPPEPRERTIAHLEPLDIRTADFDAVPEFDEPMSAHADPIDLTIDLQHAATDVGEHTATQASPYAESDGPATTTTHTTTHTATHGATVVQPPAATPVRATPPPPAVPPAAPRGDADPGTGRGPNASEHQRIVTIRVCAANEARWPGQRLMSALELHGLAFGRYGVFHRKHLDGRSLFCVASLVEPGTFDLARMAAEDYRGVTMFAVLPGPLDPVQTLDALFETAGGLAEELAGVVQDHKGVVMTMSSAKALREEMAQYQALLAS